MMRGREWEKSGQGKEAGKETEGKAKEKGNFIIENPIMLQQCFIMGGLVGYSVGFNI